MRLFCFDLFYPDFLSLVEFISFSLVLSLFSTGFPKTLSFSVFNTSCVTLTFTLRVLGDGRGSSSVSYEEHLSDVSRNNRQFFSERIPVRPAEFTISPSSASVSPQSHVTIQVKFGFFLRRKRDLVLPLEVM